MVGAASKSKSLANRAAAHVVSRYIDRRHHSCLSLTNWPTVQSTIYSGRLVGSLSGVAIDNAFVSAQAPGSATSEPANETWVDGKRKRSKHAKCHGRILCTGALRIGVVTKVLIATFNAATLS
jgi:hypothetical protein